MAEEPLLIFDEQPALPGQDEERLLLILGVVEPVRFARLQDVESDAELRELERLALEVARRAGRPLFAVLLPSTTRLPARSRRTSRR